MTKGLRALKGVYMISEMKNALRQESAETLAFDRKVFLRFKLTHLQEKSKWRRE